MASFLHGIARVSMMCGGAFSEPDKGYDMTRVGSIAVHKNGMYKTSSSKAQVINGEFADYFIVLCQTDLFAQPFTAGSSLFIVEAGRHPSSASGISRACLPLFPAANAQNFMNHLGQLPGFDGLGQYFRNPQTSGF